MNLCYNADDRAGPYARNQGTRNPGRAGIVAEQPDAAAPRARDAIQDSTGNFYGTTFRGGTAGPGVVYKLDTAGQETALFSFTGGAGGGQPEAGVIRDSAGNLYGSTYSGGKEGGGVVFKLKPQ